MIIKIKDKSRKTKVKRRRQSSKNPLPGGVRGGLKIKNKVER